MVECIKPLNRVNIEVFWLISLMKWLFYYHRRFVGEMAEWSNAAVLKTVVPQKRDRGFESHSLLQSFLKAKQEALYFLA